MVQLTLKKTSNTDQIKGTPEVPAHASKLNLWRQEFNSGLESGRERKRQIQRERYLANFKIGILG